MKRILAIAACVVVIGLVVAGIAYGLTSDGPAAYTVRGTEVSQRSVDDELSALVDNQALQAAVAQQNGAPLAATPGSITAATTAGWLGLRVAQTAAALAMERKGLEATADDKTRGHELALQSVGGDPIFSTLPESFQDDLDERWTNVAVLEADVLANPTADLLDQVAQLCPSGRYVSHILVETQQQAAAIKQAIDRGGDFAEIAASSSTDASKQNGGALGCIDGQQFVEPFATVAATQPIGVVSDPFQTEFGYHLVLVGDQPSDADLQQVALETVLGRVTGSAAVTVDPRYGIWDRRNGQVIPPVVPGTTPATAPAPGG